MTIMAPKFQMQHVGINAAALHALEEASIGADVIAALQPLLWQHCHGEWGNLDAHDKRANESALKTGARILSSYTLFGVKLWIISEAAYTDDPRVREATTVLRPEDY